MKQFPTKKEQKLVKRSEEIRKDFKNGLSMSQISRKYGITRQRVWQIIKLYTPPSVK